VRHGALSWSFRSRCLPRRRSKVRHRTVRSAITHLVIVDGHTGQILQFIERTWDYSVDGYP
jgi:hypothetical protein